MSNKHAIAVTALKMYLACNGDLNTDELVALVLPAFPNNTRAIVNQQCSYARTLAGMLRDLGPRTINHSQPG